MVVLSDIKPLFSSGSTDTNPIPCYVGHLFQMVKIFAPPAALNRVYEDHIAFQLLVGAASNRLQFTLIWVQKYHLRDISVRSRHKKATIPPHFFSSQF